MSIDTLPIDPDGDRDLSAAEALKLLDQMEAPSASARNDRRSPDVETRLRNDLKAILRSVLKIEPEDMSEQRTWMDYGLDSIASTELAGRFLEAFRITVPPTIFFEFQNLKSFVGYLLDNHAGELEAKYGAPPARAAEPAREAAKPHAAAPPAARRSIEELWGAVRAPAPAAKPSVRLVPVPSAPDTAVPESAREPDAELLESRQRFVDAARILTVRRGDGSVLECAVYGSGPPVLLLGGLLMHHSVMWRLQLEALGRRHRLIMFHMPGTGGVPLDDGVTLKSVTGDIADLLDGLGIIEPLPVVGYSFGGVLAQAFCLEHPHRCSALSVSVSTPAAEGADDFQALMRELQKSARFMVLNRGWPMTHLPAYERITDGFDVRARLGGIRVPTLIVAAAHDRYMPVARSRAIAERIPGARLHTFPDAGHLACFTHHEAWNALLLDFLDSVTRTRREPAAPGTEPAFRPATPETLEALEAYVANAQQGHGVMLSPQAAQAALLLDALCNEGKAEPAAYRSYFLTSRAEAFDTALRFARHHARNRNADGAVLVIDRSLRWRDHFDPLRRGTDDALVPGVTVVADRDAAERAAAGPLAGGVAAVAVVADAADDPAEVEAALALARRTGGLAVLVEPSGAGWFSRRIAVHPDVVVFGEGIAGHQVPVGACVVRDDVANPWQMTPNEGYVRHPMSNFGLTLHLALHHLGDAVALSTDKQREMRRIASSQRANHEAHLRYGNAGYARVARMHGFDARFIEGRGTRSRVAAAGEPAREIIDCLSNVGTAPRGLNPPDVIARVAKAHDPQHDYWSDLRDALQDETGFDAALPAASYVAGHDAALTLGLLASPERRRLVAFSGGAAFSLIGAATGHDRLLDIFRRPFGPLWSGCIAIDPAAPDAVERFEREVAAGDVALVWLETIQVEGNATRPLPRALVEAVVRHREAAGYLIGVDESQTNLWTGRLLHSKGIVPQPDIVLLGTALCDSLLPMGVVLTRKTVLARAARINAAHLDDLERRGTCQLAAHVALNALHGIRAGRLMERAVEAGAHFRARLEALARDLPIIRDVRGEGLLLTIELNLDGHAPFIQQSFGYLLWGAMFRDAAQGVAAVVCPLHNNCLRFVPPLTITFDEVDLIVASLRRHLGAGVEEVVRLAARHAAHIGDARMAEFLDGLTSSKDGTTMPGNVTRLASATRDTAARGFHPAAAKPGLPRVCIVGAGVAGISMAKQLMERGIPFDCYDKRDRAAGIWAYDAERKHTSVWNRMNMNTPRGRYQFSDFPMPESYADFPQRQQAYEYLQNYIDRFGFRDRIRLNTGVEKTRRMADGRWEVTLDTGEVLFYDMLVVGNGHHNEPNFPPYYHRDTFDGHAIHSKFYRDREDFTDKNVLVVGVGNSGGQIAVDISLAARMTYLSLRRGVYILPHYLFGLRLDKVIAFTNDWWFKKLLPFPLFHLYHTAMYKLFIHKRHELGMPKPDHWMMAALPTLSENFQNRVGDGRLKIVPEVQRIEGKRVFFVDGTSIEMDAIVYSTGFNTTFPFLEPEILTVEQNRIPLFRRIFRPGVDNLAFIGCFQAVAWGFLDIMEKQARLVADYIMGQYRLPTVPEQEADIARDQKVIAREFLGTPRNNYEMHGPTYSHDLDVEKRRGYRRAAKVGFAKPVQPYPDTAGHDRAEAAD
ncbi:MAG TPA: alpha/beta fold hydrolase [Azospirillum sp.]